MMNRDTIVLLDLGGVALQPSELIGKKINWKIINELNAKYEAGLQYTFLDLISEHNTLTTQSLSEKEFVTEVFKTLQLNKELIAIVSHYADIIIVSDNYKESVAYMLDRFNFEKWSIKQIYSYEYKMVKSNPDFFKKFLRENPEYDAKDLILIDDSETKLESASKSGIKGILYTNNDQTKTTLEELLTLKN